MPRHGRRGVTKRLLLRLHLSLLRRRLPRVLSCGRGRSCCSRGGCGRRRRLGLLRLLYRGRRLLALLKQELVLLLADAVFGLDLALERMRSCDPGWRDEGDELAPLGLRGRRGCNTSLGSGDACVRG